MIRLFYISAAAIIFFSSCCSTKKIQTAVVKKDTVAVVVTPPIGPIIKEDTAAIIKEQLAQLQSNRINFTTFGAKIDIDFTDGDGKNFDANAHLRMYKDSIIWVSITGPLGIEGLRAFITKDSVKLLDKQKKVYTARSVSYLQEMTDLPLDLNSLQNLLVGNPVFLDSNISSYNKSAETITLVSVGDFFRNILSISTADKLVQSSQLNDVDETHTRTSLLTYDEYESKKVVQFATKRVIEITDKKKLLLKMNFKQYDFNETLSFPFSVPKSYDRE
jgi:Domain of unknown function (DUF4292)